MDGSLSNKPENFVDDPEKIYTQRRREARSRKPKLVDSKVEADGSSSSPQATPPTSPKGGATSPKDGATGAGAYDRRAMHSGRSGLADPKSRQHRSSVRDQDFNHKDGAKLALYWKRRR